MQRREASRLFREICECIPDVFMLKGVFLTKQNVSADSKKERFSLRMKAALDERSLKLVKSVVKERKLAIEEDKGAILIYDPKTAAAEISVVA